MKIILISLMFFYFYKVQAQFTFPETWKKHKTSANASQIFDFFDQNQGNNAILQVKQSRNFYVTLQSELEDIKLKIQIHLLTRNYSNETVEALFIYQQSQSKLQSNETVSISYKINEYLKIIHSQGFFQIFLQKDAHKLIDYALYIIYFLILCLIIQMIAALSLLPCGLFSQIYKCNLLNDLIYLEYFMIAREFLLKYQSNQLISILACAFAFMFGLAVLKITISKNIYNLKRFILYLPLTFWILSALGVMKSDQIILILLLMHVIDLHRLFPPRKYDEYYYSQICLSSGSNLILLLIFSIAKKFLFSSQNGQISFVIYFISFIGYFLVNLVKLYLINRDESNKRKNGDIYGKQISGHNLVNNTIKM